MGGTALLDTATRIQLQSSLPSCCVRRLHVHSSSNPRLHSLALRNCHPRQPSCVKVRVVFFRSFFCVCQPCGVELSSPISWNGKGQICSGSSTSGLGNNVSEQAGKRSHAGGTAREGKGERLQKKSEKLTYTHLDSGGEEAGEGVGENVRVNNN